MFEIFLLQTIHVTLSRYRCKNYISFTNLVTSEVAQNINDIFYSETNTFLFVRK